MGRFESLSLRQLFPYIPGIFGRSGGIGKQGAVSSLYSRLETHYPEETWSIFHLPSCLIKVISQGRLLPLVPVTFMIIFA